MVSAGERRAGGAKAGSREASARQSRVDQLGNVGLESRKQGPGGGAKLACLVSREAKWGWLVGWGESGWLGESRVPGGLSWRGESRVPGGGLSWRAWYPARPASEKTVIIEASWRSAERPSTTRSSDSTDIRIAAVRYDAHAGACFVGKETRTRGTKRECVA